MGYDLEVRLKNHHFWADQGKFYNLSGTYGWYKNQ